MPRHIEQPGSRHSKPRIEDDIEALLLGLVLDLLRAGDAQGAQAGLDLFAGQNRRRHAQVLDAPVGARADEHGVERNVGQRRVGREGHVVEGALSGAAVGGVGDGGGVGHAARDRATMPGDVPHET
jgi:hypothetical protein